MYVLRCSISTSLIVIIVRFANKPGLIDMVVE